MDPRICDPLQLLERQEIVAAANSPLAAVHDAAELGEHPQVGVEHGHVRVAAVVSLGLELGLSDALTEVSLAVLS